jgi:threonine dehydratase
MSELSPAAAVVAADAPPTLADIDAASERLAPYVRRTPIWEWRDDSLDAILGGSSTEITLKLELFQASGTFKARAR